MTGQIFRVGLQFGGLAVLARLLDPTDYGLLAMVLALVGIGEVIREFGLSSAAIQSPTVTFQQRSNLWWINVSLGAILTILVILCAPLIAAFYGQPELTAIAIALSGTFLINGAATQYRADLYRNMKFGRIASVDVVAQAVALSVSISLAVNGFGYWALVAQQIVQAIVLLLLIVALNPWIPALPRRRSGTKKFLRFGWNLLATQLIGYASRNVDSLIIGTRFGPEQLGVYNRAFQLFMLPLNQFNVPATRVALPILSRIQSDKDEFDRFILKGQAILLHILVALFALAASQAQALVAVVLGPSWSGVTPILQVLIIGGVFQAAAYSSYWVFLSKGLTGSNLRFSLITRVMLIALIFAGSSWGVLGVAWSYTIGLAIIWPAGLIWLSRVSDAPAKGMLLNGLRIIGGYLPCALVSFAVAQWAHRYGDLQSLALGCLSGIVVFLITIAIWPGFRSNFLDLLRTRQLMRRSR